MNGSAKSPPIGRASFSDSGRQFGNGLEQTDGGSSSSRGEDEGSAFGGSEGRDGERADGVVPPASRNRVSGRSDTRIPGEDVDPDVLLASFESGDPATVYNAFKTLVRAYKATYREASRLRFQVNFGTPICESCEGLRAGPGVVATCFQVRACNFTNVKEGDVRTDHRMILKRMSHNTKSLDINSTHELGIGTKKTVGSAQQTDEPHTPKKYVKES